MCGGGLLPYLLNLGHCIACRAARCPFNKPLILCLFFTLSWMTAAKAQDFSIKDQNAWQLVDVCRIKVAFGVVTSTSLAFSLYLTEDNSDEIQLSLVSLSRDGAFTNSIQNNEYANLISITHSPSSLPPDALNTPFITTLWLNLPSDFAKTITSFRISSGPQEVQTTRSYSIAQNCPKGN